MGTGDFDSSVADAKWASRQFGARLAWTFIPHYRVFMPTVLADTAWVLAQSLEEGAAIVETQFGHGPLRLAIGGLLVWITCIGLMLDPATLDAAIAGLLATATR
jgi:hypothetical protein